MGENCNELIDALRNFREEYILTLMREARLKDKYGNIWDVEKVEFTKDMTILRLGLDGTKNYTAVIIHWDEGINELKDYEVITKGSEG